MSSTMQCFRSQKDPSIISFVITPDQLQANLAKFNSVDAGRMLLQCFPDTLASSPNNWPMLLAVNNMYTIVVCKHRKPVSSIMYPSDQKCMSLWSALRHEDIVILGSVQFIQDSAYVWNVCKNKGCTHTCPYASHHIFDAALALESITESIKRLSLNVDSKSFAFNAAVKSYRAYGFKPSLLAPVGIPGILAFMGQSRFQRMDFEILRS